MSAEKEIAHNASAEWRKAREKVAELRQQLAEAEKSEARAHLQAKIATANYTGEWPQW